MPFHEDMIFIVDLLPELHHCFLWIHAGGSWQRAASSWQEAEPNFEFRIADFELQGLNNSQLNNSRDSTDEGRRQRAASSSDLRSPVIGRLQEPRAEGSEHRR